jgi:hypothetical protein
MFEGSRTTLPNKESGGETGLLAVHAGISNDLCVGRGIKRKFAKRFQETIQGGGAITKQGLQN